MEDPVQAQVDAYNARDIDAFVAAYDAEVVRCRDMSRRSATSTARVRGLARRGRVVGPIVDHERVSRGGETRELLVAYHVAAGLITRVLLLG